MYTSSASQNYGMQPTSYVLLLLEHGDVMTELTAVECIMLSYRPCEKLPTVADGRIVRIRIRWNGSRVATMKPKLIIHWLGGPAKKGKAGR